MKKKVFFMALAAIVAFASCDNDVESGSRYLSGYFTIAGDAKQGYTLYQDGGGIIKPSLQSITAIAGKDGFANNERAFLNLSYKTDDIKPTDGGEMIAEANVMGGEYMPLHFPLTQKEADDKKVTSRDSTFSVNRISQVWAYRGFLNTLVNANVSMKDGKRIAPGMNIVYDPAKIAENKIDFTIYYNRHTSKETNAGSAVDFASTFPLYKMSELIPGKDSVEVTIHIEGAKPQTLKIGRSDLTKDNYLPYKKQTGSKYATSNYTTLYY